MQRQGPIQQALELPQALRRTAQPLSLRGKQPGQKDSLAEYPVPAVFIVGAAAEQKQQQPPRGIDVRSRSQAEVAVIFPDDLRGGVAGSGEYHAVRDGVRLFPAALAIPQRPGAAKIQQAGEADVSLFRPGVGEEDIPHLHVAVQIPGLVDQLQRPEDPLQNTGRGVEAGPASGAEGMALPGRQETLRQQLGQEHTGLADIPQDQKASRGGGAAPLCRFHGEIPRRLPHGNGPAAAPGHSLADLRLPQHPLPGFAQGVLRPVIDADRDALFPAHPLRQIRGAALFDSKTQGAALFFRGVEQGTAAEAGDFPQNISVIAPAEHRSGGQGHLHDPLVHFVTPVIFIHRMPSTDTGSSGPDRLSAD